MSDQHRAAQLVLPAFEISGLRVASFCGLKLSQVSLTSCVFLSGGPYDYENLWEFGEPGQTRALGLPLAVFGVKSSRFDNIVAIRAALYSN